MSICKFGFVELQNVTEERISGSFEITLGGIPSFNTLRDEFPRDLEFRTFNLHGDFTTEYGNYEDLAELRAERIKQLLESGGNVGGGVLIF